MGALVLCRHLQMFLGQVEKNEDADLKIEQDGNKPEDKAHKAATKIQASFRGHIIRKKMKDGDKEEDEEKNAPAEGAAEGEEEKKEATSPAAEKPEETADAKSPVSDKPANPSATSPVAANATTPVATSPAGGAAEPTGEEPKKETAPEAKEQPRDADSKDVPVPVPSVQATSPSTEKQPEDKEEPKQADVPAASETADCEETNQTQDKPDAAGDSKPTEETPSEANKEEEKNE
uniref:Neuromodulin n=1 Tax=Denticeps clupeoides TaxID=299321 RepID=A0AAY4B5L5_9TELE